VSGQYDVVVVGVGMLGASAARHLSDAGARVALVGPVEPVDRRTDPVAFSNRVAYSSHEDVARVSRTIDPDPIRAWLGHRSVPQFADIAERTGLAAVNPVGHLWLEAAPGLDLLASADERFGLGCVRRDVSATVEAFPFLSVAEGTDQRPMESLWEPPPAGSVDPRIHVRAEAAAALATGAEHIDALVGSVVEGTGSVEVATDSGTVLADRVLLATGAFSGLADTPAAGLDLEYALHTQLIVHLDADEVERLDGMPSIIAKCAEPLDDFYLTPPVRDPLGSDDRWILKIGAPQDDHVRLKPDELATWYRTDGDPVFAANLTRILHRLVPGLRDVGRWTTSCVTTYTPSGHPFIDRLGDRTVCSIGGNGYAAKCAPALGELAAGLLLGWDWSTEIDRELFVARFED
tara:strand:+ start:7338 stop:8552 length:1215 start_codon:yes stop_codon:yes gene_type:complete